MKKPKLKKKNLKHFKLLTNWHQLRKTKANVRSWRLLHRRRTKANEMPEAGNDVCMPSLCFHENIFSSKVGDNISLVGMSWRFIGRYKNITLKMSLWPGNKSFNFYLQKSIAWGEPSLRQSIFLYVSDNHRENCVLLNSVREFIAKSFYAKR